MTLQDVEDRLAQILANKNNNELAHVLEDELYWDVMREIAAGTAIARELAEAALKSQELQLYRWYA